MLIASFRPLKSLWFSQVHQWWYQHNFGDPTKWNHNWHYNTLLLIRMSERQNLTHHSSEMWVPWTVICFFCSLQMILSGHFEIPLTVLSLAKQYIIWCVSSVCTLCQHFKTIPSVLCQDSGSYTDYLNPFLFNFLLNQYNI